MFDIALFIALVVLVVMYTTWRTCKREAARKAGDTKRAGRHRAKGRPTMTWRG